MSFQSTTLLNGTTLFTSTIGETTATLFFASRLPILPVAAHGAILFGLAELQVGVNDVAAVFEVVVFDESSHGVVNVLLAFID